jgi:choline dehydrogenase-like flavoprotein
MSIEPISIEAAAARHWDVIIGGSSFAAMFFLLGLPTDLSVLVVEKGTRQSHDAQLALRHIPNREHFAQTDNSGLGKEWVAHSLWGGNSNCWWACTPRFHPNDFALKTRYGVGADWPFGYDALAPFYEEVEALMQIAGGGSDAVLPRTKAFPFPPHLPSRTDKLFRRHDSAHWWAQPTARANGGDRSTCCANGVCQLCPVDSKFTILNSETTFERPQVFSLTAAELRRVDIVAGQTHGAELRQAGKDYMVRADMVALGCNAIHNPVILQRSGYEHPALGRGLNEQVSVRVAVDGEGLGYFGGTSITGHGYPLYDGPHRRDVAAVLIEIYNAPAQIKPVPGRWTQRTVLKLIAEDLPQDRNQVVLDPVSDEPHLIWHGHSEYALAGIERGIAALPDLLPQGVELAGVSPPAATEAHIIGTHRMGLDVTQFVTDPGLAVHGLPGAYLLGAGAFPAGSAANPTLTLAALSLRSARTLQ